MSFPTYHHSDLEDGEYSRSTSDEYQFDDPRDHILHVYSAVWSEFYRWEPDASRGVLTSLRRDRQGPVDLPFGDELQPEYACHLGLDNTEQDLCFSYDMAGGSSDIITFEGITAKPYLAHPPYEACTPVSRNIAWREGDYDDSQQCQFIPYADDPLFDSGRYLKHFSEGLAWDAVKNVCTPDVEMIQLETVRRLYLSQPSIPLDVIDESGVLPKLYPDSAAHLFSGFLWEVTQRDALAWPGASFSTLGSLEYTRACSEDDILSRVNSVIWHSCPNLNCVDPHCRTHNFAYPSLVPKRPTLNSINLYPTLAATCGPDCFLNIADFDIFQESVLWGEEDMRALQDILAIVPDSSPCDLAVICRKPCNEAFVQRCLIFPDETIYVPPSGLESEPEPLVFVEELDTYSRIAAIRPCSHDGPCNRRSKCPCWESQMRCQRNCRCDLECRRRFPGCDCKSSGPYTCESANFCPCARAGRECDPELCMPCFSKKGKCARQTIQSADYASTIVKNGTWGMGLFSAETIFKNALIGEYNGDILWEHFIDHRISIQKYRGMNYQFDLDSAASGSYYLAGGDPDQRENFFLDSMRAGNCTMYINHAPEKQANVHAECRSVNSESRIAIFASKTIPIGKELFLYYGEKYFGDKDGDSDGEGDHRSSAHISVLE